MYNTFWYDTLAKPFLTPPPEVFAPAWIILYITIIVSLIIFTLTKTSIENLLSDLKQEASDFIQSFYYEKIKEIRRACNGAHDVRDIAGGMRRHQSAPFSRRRGRRDQRGAGRKRQVYRHRCGRRNRQHCLQYNRRQRARHDRLFDRRPRRAAYRAVRSNHLRRGDKRRSHQQHGFHYRGVAVADIRHHIGKRQR